jgi:hypothetical protein
VKDTNYEAHIKEPSSTSGYFLSVRSNYSLQQHSKIALYPVRPRQVSKDGGKYPSVISWHPDGVAGE